MWSYTGEQTDSGTSQKFLITKENMEAAVKAAQKSRRGECTFGSQTTNEVRSCLLYTSPSPRDP